MTLATAFYRLGQFLQETMLPNENMGTLTILNEQKAICWQFHGEEDTWIDIWVEFHSPIIIITNIYGKFQWNCDKARFE